MSDNKAKSIQNINKLFYNNFTDFIFFNKKIELFITFIIIKKVTYIEIKYSAVENFSFMKYE